MEVRRAKPTYVWIVVTFSTLLHLGFLRLHFQMPKILSEVGSNCESSQHSCHCVDDVQINKFLLLKMCDL